MPTQRPRPDVYAVGDFFSPDKPRGVISAIHEGGFARVYIVDPLPFGASDEADRQRYPQRAFKTPLEKYHPRVWQAFYNEASLWLRLSGLPFVLPALSIVRHNQTGRPFVEMEVATGRLREVISSNATGLPLNTALEIVIRCLEGLKVAAERGFQAHLDLKPENIFLERRSDHPEALELRSLMPLIADFGLARCAESQATEGFTKVYAPPEQYPGTSGALGPWSDNYSLAIVLVELITGLLPDGRSWSGLPSVYGETVVAKSIACSWLRMMRLPPALPSSVRTAIESALEPEPAKRPQTHAALQTALYKALSDVEGEAWTTKYRELIVEWWRQGIRPTGVWGTIATTAPAEWPETVVASIENLSRIDRFRATAEAVQALEHAEKPAATVFERRVGARAGCLLARWEIDKRPARALDLFDRSLAILFATADLQDPAEHPDVHQRMKDPLASRLVQDISYVLAWRYRDDPASKASHVETLIPGHPRLAPYLCWTLAVHTESQDAACGTYWRLRAVELLGDEAEFHRSLADYCETVERLEDIMNYSGISSPCSHERQVPWSSAAEREALILESRRRAARADPARYGHPPGGKQPLRDQDPGVS